MHFRRGVFRAATICVFAFMPMTVAAKDVLVEVLFWGEISSAASKGIQSYQRLHAERELWKSEISRLQEELRNCTNCDRQRLQSELDAWENTQNSYQSFVGNVMGQMGYDANAMRLFGVENPGQFLGAGALSATGRKDYVDIDALPDPDWLADAGDLCRGVFEQWKQCSKEWQDAGRRPANMCEAPNRLKTYCAKGDVLGAQDYIQMLSLRRAGIPIPEIHDVGYFLTVDYGQTTGPVTPRVAKGWQMYDYMLENPERRAISFELDRPGETGVWSRMTYERFFPMEFREYRDLCMGLAKEEPAVCAQLKPYERNNPESGFVAPALLTCDYTRAQPGAVNRVRFWLYRKPPSARLMGRLSREAAEMTVANFCPPRYRDAVAIRQGRLSQAEINAIDYTTDLRALSAQERLPSEEGYDPTRVWQRIAGYADIIEAEGLSLKDLDAERARRSAAQAREVKIAAERAKAAKAAETRAAERKKLQEAETEKQASLADRRNPTPENWGKETASLEKMDVLGFQLGMTREDIDTLVPQRLGAIQKSKDVLQTGPEELFPFNRHIITKDGSLIIFAFDREGPDGLLIGVSRTVPSGKTPELVEALVEKYRPWQPDILGKDISDPRVLSYILGMNIGEATCLHGVRQARPGIPTLSEGISTDLPKWLIERTVLSADYRDLIRSELENCDQALRVAFHEKEFSTTLVDKRLAARAFLSRRASAPKPKVPDL